MREVCAAVIEREGRVLIGRRGKGRGEGMWEFPGGKRQAGETPEECVARECQEELGIVLDVGDCLTAFDWNDPPMRFSFFRASLKAGEPACSVHTELAWVSPDALAAYAFCSADVEALARMRLAEKKGEWTCSIV